MSSVRPRNRYSVLWVFALLAAATSPVYAHAGHALEPHDLWESWEFDPVTVCLLIASAVMYAVGCERIRRSTGGRPYNVWSVRAFWAGWWSLVVALVSPLHTMGGVLFAAHMVQHEILMLIAAPLLVLGRPLVPFLWSLPISWRRRLGSITRSERWMRFWRKLTAPLAAWIIHAVALWVWHAPAFFQATLHNEFVHALQHASFLGSALLFSWALVQSSRGVVRYGAAVLYVFTTAIHTSILGALLSFSGTIWYPAYAHTTAAWGYTPLEDQQLGGLIMWIPAGIVYLVAGLAFFAMWMKSEKAPVFTVPVAAGFSEFPSHLTSDGVSDLLSGLHGGLSSDLRKGS